MLQCTPTAAAALEQVRRQRDLPEGTGVRFAPAESAEGEIGLTIRFIDTPLDGDRVIRQHGATLVIAPELSDDLEHFVLDVVPEPGTNGDVPSQLVLRPDDPS